MRKGPDFDPSKRNADFMVDWKENPQQTLEKANKKLKLWNLEFVVHETHSDTYAFSIQPIPRKK
jgi:hypothetical protein